jgi:putative membrane-bound dehydrogenase-like protein
VRFSSLFAFSLMASCAITYAQPKARPDGTPTAADSRLVVELFAAAPDIVHPIATDFDSKGRLLVVESHTHFRPPKYDGPKHDRVRILEDTNGDGKADKFTTFFEGTTATMDLAVHPDGSVYIATRNEILRLRDTDNDGKADEKTRIAFLDTTGNYPHNGLSGLCFDSRGDLYFGMGENLGATYKLSGADGSSFSGGGEGGNFFWITSDGKKLRRVATGFWNPFGACRDIFGRIFVVDNDPDASPPCRLLHVVEGGDYGYQFRYGRSGRHPFQSWNGELPGTLPMAAGTGESPCEVIAYESDGLPKEYLGDLLVPIWSDHRVERYVPRNPKTWKPFVRKPFIQGGKDFYPSGLTVAPDGSLFVTDWGSRSYELHGKGAVWHVRWKDARPGNRSTDPHMGIISPHRPTRELTARKYSESEEGRGLLADGLRSPSVRVRITCLDALLEAGARDLDLRAMARNDKEFEARALAVRKLVAQGADVNEFVAGARQDCVRVEAIAGLTKDTPVGTFLELLIDTSPFVRHAAIQRLGRLPELLGRIEFAKLTDPKQRIGILLAWRASTVENESALTQSLADADPELRLLAAKWVADERLTKYRDKIVELLKMPDLDPRSLIALTTTLARLDDKPVNEDALAGYFLERVKDAKAPATTRLQALRGIPATHKLLRTELLTDLLKHEDSALRIEALRALKDRADPKAADAVRAIAGDRSQPASVRAQSIVTLAAMNQVNAGFVIELAGGKDDGLRQEALRALVQTTLTDDQRMALKAIANEKAELADLAARALAKPFHANRPPATDTDAWLKRLEGPANAEAGRRIFESPKVATCAKCHRVDGRGADVGPDLSLVGRNDRRSIVESILQPSTAVAPHFQAWKIDTLDGRALVGQLVHTYLDESYYIDAKGDRFKVEAKDVAEITAAKGSIMPDGLIDTLTDQEIRDLVAYLASRK